MRLKSVSLTNVCQHRDLKLEFPLGVTGIFGSNGVGKSNLVKMIKASLTGDFPNGRSANVCRLDYAEDHPKGYKTVIETEWMHSGTDISITRRLKPSKDEMIIGATTLSKTRDINDHIESVLGLSSKVINEFIFVDQWSIFQFLSATPASRAKLFAHLCGTERIEKLWNLLGDQIREDSSLLTSETDLTSFEDGIRETLKTNKKEITSLKRSITKSKKSLIPKLIDEYRQSVVDYRASHRFEKLYAEKTESIKQVKEDLAELEDVGEVPTDTEFYELKNEITNLKGSIKDLKKTLKILKDGCPTCGHTIDSDEEYKRISKPIKREGREKSSRLTEAESELVAVRAVRERAADINSRRQPLESKLSTLKSSLSEIEEAIEELSSADLDVDVLEAAIEQHDTATNAITLTESKINTLTFENTRLESQLADIDKKKKTSSIAKGWVDDLEELRSVFHRDSLPKLIASQFLKTLVVKINETLENFETPFLISADDDLSFLAHKSNGVVEPAERLSGGEKVVLAIAFRLAINSLFVGEIGMMVLDEPTAGLDEHNLGCLADVLSKLCDLTRKKGQQIIMITHEARLQRVFDNVIHLGNLTYADEESDRLEVVRG